MDIKPRSAGASHVAALPTEADPWRVHHMRAEQLAEALSSSGHIDLVLTDPPWTYDQEFGATTPEDHYAVLDYPTISRTLGLFFRNADRLAMWCSNAHLGPFAAHLFAGEKPWPWGPWVTGGSWDKGPVQYGQGYHAAGRTEPWVLFTGRRPGFNDRKVLLTTGHQQRAGVHSAKPVDYQARMIRRWVPPGGLVVDPFVGWGSVALATKQAGEGRRFVGCDIDPERVGVVRERLAAPDGHRP